MPYYPGKEPVQPEKKDRKKMIRIGAIGLSCALILYGSVRLIQYYADLNASRNISRELKQIYMQEEAIRIKSRGDLRSWRRQMTDL